jgi:hypothetical protein
VLGDTKAELKLGQDCFHNRLMGDFALAHFTGPRRDSLRMDNNRHMPLDAGLKRIAHVLEEPCATAVAESQVKRESVVIGSIT